MNSEFGIRKGGNEFGMRNAEFGKGKNWGKRENWRKREQDAPTSVDSSSAACALEAFSISEAVHRVTASSLSPKPPKPPKPAYCCANALRANLGRASIRRQRQGS